MRIRNCLYLACFVAACGGGTTEPDKNGNGNGTGNGSAVDRVASVVVTPLSVKLEPGERTVLTAIVVAESGLPMNRSVTWRSNNTSIASVSSAGEVVGVAVGETTVTASVDGKQASAVVTVRAVPTVANVTVVNQLIYPITITVNGQNQGTVSAQGSRQLTGVAAGALTIVWNLMRPTLGSTPLGESMGGTFSATLIGGTTRSFTVDNQVGSTTYFAPLVTNQTSQPMLLVVNYGLQSELRCNCTAGAGGTRVQFGYYRLFSNSNVTVFRTSSNYNGSFRYFDNFASLITTGSGTREFLFSIAP